MKSYWQKKLSNIDVSEHTRPILRLYKSSTKSGKQLREHNNLLTLIQLMDMETMKDAPNSTRLLALTDVLKLYHKHDFVEAELISAVWRCAYNGQEDVVDHILPYVDLQHTDGPVAGAIVGEHLGLVQKLFPLSRRNMNFYISTAAQTKNVDILAFLVDRADDDEIERYLEWHSDDAHSLVRQFWMSRKEQRILTQSLPDDKSTVRVKKM